MHKISKARHTMRFGSGRARRCRLEPLEDRRLLSGDGEIHGRVTASGFSLGVFSEVLAGWIVYLDQNQNQQFDPDEDFSITDGNGDYAFTGLDSTKTYYVAMSVPVGLQATIQPALTMDARYAVITIDFPAGPVVFGADFVIKVDVFVGASQVAGTVFLDSNSNGRQDPGETGLAGWTVYSDKNSDGVLDDNEHAAVTSANGGYLLDSTDDENVRIVPQAGMMETSPVSNTFVRLPAVATGSQPGQSAVGDFNRDGFQDLVVPNAGSDSVTILSNDGTGQLSMGSVVLLAAGSGPVGCVVGDFNNDTRPDIAVTDANANKVTILLNTTAIAGTAPSFQVATVATGGNRPVGIAAADFDHDGYADLAVTNEYSADVSILRNGGSTAAGTFTLSSTVGAGRFPVALVAVQLNDDNNDGVIDAHDFVDLAVANYVDNSITLLENDGTSAFTALVTSPATGAQPAAIVTADFNHDGKPDLAVADLTSTGVSVLLGFGNGLFPTSQFYPLDATTIASSMVASDMDGDGNTDLVVSSGAIGTAAKVFVLHNPGDARFTPLQYATVSAIPSAFAGGLPPVAPLGNPGTSSGVYLAAADVDHDASHTNDLIVINGLSTSVTVLSNTWSPGAYRVFANPDSYAGLDFGVQAVIPWKNPANPLDVNNNGSVTAFDALIVINELLLHGSHPLSASKPPGAFFLDVNGNGSVGPTDVLGVVNFLLLRTAAADAPSASGAAQPARAEARDAALTGLIASGLAIAGAAVDEEEISPVAQPFLDPLISAEASNTTGPQPVAMVQGVLIDSTGGAERAGSAETASLDDELLGVLAAGRCAGADRRDSVRQSSNRAAGG